jgi:hypothetical protein
MIEHGLLVLPAITYFTASKRKAGRDPAHRED